MEIIGIKEWLNAPLLCFAEIEIERSIQWLAAAFGRKALRKSFSV